nr:hypothetical protein CFP56_06788 [Quercus suber]
MATANVARINHAEPGPIDMSLLRQQPNHRSEAIWNEQDPRTFTCRSRSSEFSNREPMVDDRVVNIIKALVNPPNSSPTAPSPSPPEYTPSPSSQTAPSPSPPEHTPPSSPTTPSPSPRKSSPPIPGPPEFTSPSSSQSNPTLPSPSPLDYARPSPNSPKTTFPIPSPPKNAPPPKLPKAPTLVPPNSNTPVPACSNNNTKGGTFARAPPVSSTVVHAGTYSTSVSFVILFSMLIATFSCIKV